MKTRIATGYRKKLRLAALLMALALVFAAFSACSAGKEEPSGTGEVPEATAEPGEPEDDEWKDYYPAGTEGKVELPYEIPEDKADRYVIKTVVFGAGLGAETGRDPFVVSFLLPPGWKVEREGEAPGGFTEIRGEDNPLKGTVYILNDAGECVGTVGFSPYYMEYDPVKNYYQIYSSIVYGGYRFMLDRSYHPFYNSEASNITALTETCFSDGSGPAVFNPAVVSHDAERGVFIAAEFFADKIDPIVLLDFAESFRIY